MTLFRLTEVMRFIFIKVLCVHFHSTHKYASDTYTHTQAAISSNFALFHSHSVYLLVSLIMAQLHFDGG